MTHSEQEEYQERMGSPEMEYLCYLSEHPEIQVEEKRCKWCNKKIVEWDLKKHEEECDFNDGGKSDMNYEDVVNKYF